MPSSSEELGKLIGKSIADTADMNQSMSHPAGQDTNIIFPTDTFEVKELATRTKQLDVGGDVLIWGSSDFGVWNTRNWGDSATVGFVLGHADLGVLGTSKLGASVSSAVTIRVISPNDTYNEYFSTREYEDTTNTTATVDSDKEEVSFTNGEVYQSTIIYKDESNILTAKPIIYVRSAANQLTLNTSVAEQELNLYVN